MIAPDPGLALTMNSSFLGYYAHAGFLEGLASLGIYPGHVSGASAGAIVAGLHASGMDAARVSEVCLSPKIVLAHMEFTGFLRLPGMFLNLPARAGVVKGHKARRFFERLLGDKRIEDCRSPALSLAVTNLSSGRSEVVTAGPLAAFLVASASFPGLFNVQKVEGQYYWDGGIANTIPFTHWLDDSNIHTIIQHIIRHDPLPNHGRFGPTIAAGFGISHQILSDELFRLRQGMSERTSDKRIVTIETIAPRPKVWSRRIAAECHACAMASAERHRDSLLAVPGKKSLNG